MEVIKRAKLEGDRKEESNNGMGKRTKMGKCDIEGL